jgi:hypothetical protein
LLERYRPQLHKLRKAKPDGALAPRFDGKQVHRQATIDAHRDAMDTRAIILDGHLGGTGDAGIEIVG